jgi:hypothetical protein
MARKIIKGAADVALGQPAQELLIGRSVAKRQKRTSRISFMAAIVGCRQRADNANAQTRPGPKVKAIL